MKAPMSDSPFFNPIEAFTKALSAGEFPFKGLSPTTFGFSQAEDALKPWAGNWQAWGELIQVQAKETQSVAQETVDALKEAKDPAAALTALQSSAQKNLALAIKHWQEVAALSVSQFTR